jgi:hypothetical protein
MLLEGELDGTGGSGTEQKIRLGNGKSTRTVVI